MQDLASGGATTGRLLAPLNFIYYLFFKIRVSLFHWLLTLNVLRGRGAVPVLV